uniref:Short-chain collagen C4-like n=1 Tax=Crassostrea virginica TaxID=6565 RepID=A0A8B8AQM5_CRAVI|nr:short-chain collagen C4-like [Crassostrea virginica]
MLHISGIWAASNNTSYKEMIQGYLTGQLSSVLGSYQVETLKREFKSFTGLMEKNFQDFKENIGIEMNKIKDRTWANKESSNIKNNRISSAVYTRWGKKTCPSGAVLVHSGFAGGSWYTHPGAAVDPLCLPRDPEWGIYKDGTDGSKAYVYGAEYEITMGNDHLSSVDEHDIPCAVCLIRNRSVAKMFAGRKTCYKGWKLEYDGYLMAGYHGHTAGTMYSCVDSQLDTLHGGHTSQNGKLFYQVEARCGSLKCPPYVEGRELVCAVCSKI